MRRKTPKYNNNIESYEHRDKSRPNNPHAGLVTPETDPDYKKKKKYKFDSDIDPKLDWAGKAEFTSFEVPTVSLHVHERIDPKTIIEQVQKTNIHEQPGLFDEKKPLREAINFYEHNDNWSNRLIAGDSLLVMNSLLEKEPFENSIQCIYMDPPFGIKYKSNFQPFVNKNNIKDSDLDEDLTSEPEMVKAFRDTWDLGIHSYLTYLRNRLLLSYRLLSESGCMFLQIGDDNVHRVSLLFDEIFGAENKVATITFATTLNARTTFLPEVEQYLLVYAKNKNYFKFNKLYYPRNRKDFLSQNQIYIEINGKSRRISKEEIENPDKYLPSNAKVYKRKGLFSPGKQNNERSEPFIYNNIKYDCADGYHWSISQEGLKNLADNNLIDFVGNKIFRKKYENEYIGIEISNLWHNQFQVNKKRYVVETSKNLIKRCILMSTQPGDIVFDPTCGSGTTAVVAEEWGRRWITCDTSRVALTLTKERLMTTNYKYYKLTHPEEGVGSGIECEEVKKISSKTIAYNEPESKIKLFDKPYEDKNKSRVTGPFTFESVPAPYSKELLDIEDNLPKLSFQTISKSGETYYQSQWRDEMLNSGIRGKNNQLIKFSRIEISKGTKYIQAVGYTESDSKKALIIFGSKYFPLEQRTVELAIDEATKIKPKAELIIFAAFQFDPEAAKEIEETKWKGITLLKVQMNDDLLTDDLRKNRKSNESFWLVGQPDVNLISQNSGGGGK